MPLLESFCAEIHPNRVENIKSTCRHVLTSVTKVRVTGPIFTKIVPLAHIYIYIYFFFFFLRYSYCNCYEHSTNILVALTMSQTHGRTDGQTWFPHKHSNFVQNAQNFNNFVMHFLHHFGWFGFRRRCIFFNFCPPYSPGCGGPEGG